MTAVREVDAVIVGAGFAGMYMLHRLRGAGLDAQVIEAGDGVGGTWYWNRYPGARVDIESLEYSYQFSEELQQEWEWGERYAPQPEILSYANHVADRFDLRRDIQFSTRVLSAVFNETSNRWHVTTDKGEQLSAAFCVMATGCLSSTNLPKFEGLQNFKGDWYHTGLWPHEGVDLAGKRVGIIGTGSSGMQMTPVIAKAAKHLTVFQRTPNFSVPAANAPVDDEEDARVKATYHARRQQALNSPTGLGFKTNRQSALDVDEAEREKVYEAAYHRLGFGFALSYHDILLSKPANDTAAEFLRRKIGERIEDPKVRAKLVPTDHAFAARRPSVDSGYFEAFNRDNVTLADIREYPIEGFEPTGLRTSEKLHELDMVIFATGFDAFTGALLKPDIRGRNGQLLRDKWAAGPITQLGVGTHGFPNLMIVVGPGSPSLLSNVMVSIEEQTDWFADLIEKANAEGIVEIEVDADAEQAWVAHVNERAQETLYMTAASYYNGAEVAGKPRVFMPYSGGIRNYRRILESCAKEGYSGFTLRRAPAAAKDRVES